MQGMVCGLGRDMGVGMMAIRGCIMSDALVEPGGGALLDMQVRSMYMCGRACIDLASTRSIGKRVSCMQALAYEGEEGTRSGAWA